MKPSFNKRKLQYGSASTLFIVLVIAAVIVLNIFADFLTDRFSLKIDMTKEGLYSLSDDTKELLREMSESVNIYVLSTQAEMEKKEDTTQTLETLRRYVSASHGNISLQFIDPNKNPQFFKKYPKAKNATLGDLVIEGPKRYMVLDTDMFTGHVESGSKVYYQSEEKLSGAVLYVTNDKVVSSGFITGHGEINPDALLSHFEGNNFEVNTEVDLLSPVSEEITNLVISAPRVDFTEVEIENLERYLAREGNALYVFWGIETPTLPVLERYLAEWGIAFESKLVCDETNAYMSQSNVIADLLETGIIDKNLQGQSYIIAPQMRPIKILFKEQGYIYTLALAETRDTSYAKPVSQDLSIKSLTKASGDVDGPHLAAVLSERASSKADSTKTSKIFAFGAYGMAFEEITAVPRAFNGTFIARLVDHANPNTKTIELSPKVDVNYDLDITEASVKLLTILLVGIIPLFFVILGIVIFIRRKNR